jgi:hypothetical protein
MPYKPTGKPPGRPRKTPKPAEVETKPEGMWRLRQSFRQAAEHQNPNPALQVLDSHGRPRGRSGHNRWIGTGWYQPKA